MHNRTMPNWREAIPSPPDGTMRTARAMRAGSGRGAVVIAIGLVLGVLLGSSTTTLAQDNTAYGEVPAFEGLSLDGEPVRASDFEGTVALINLWGIWCPPCVEELPYLQQVHEHFEDDSRVRVVAVHCTIRPDRSRGDVEAWLRERGLDLPVIYDDDTSIKEAFGFGGIPENILVGPQGRIVQRIDDRPHDTFTDRAIQAIDRVLRGETTADTER